MCLYLYRREEAKAYDMNWLPLVYDRFREEVDCPSYLSPIALMPRNAEVV